MTHFDFKTLLSAQLEIEDRVSMAHSFESRVPFVEHAVGEFAAALPADVKFRNGELKHALKSAAESVLQRGILKHEDKMGFPVPLGTWMHDGLNGFLVDTCSEAAHSRSYVNPLFDIRSLID